MERELIFGGIVLGAWLLWPKRADASAAEPVPASPLAPLLPPSADGREGASAIMIRTARMSQHAREQEFLRLIRLNNVPSWTWNTVDIGGGKRVTKDFLSIGHDEDFMWIPLTPSAATQLLIEHGLRLPNRAEAEATYAYARANGGFLAFQSFSPERGQTRWGNTAVSQSAQKIKNTMTQAAPVFDGHKKYVLGRTNEGKVIIFGGHHADGGQVQPYSTLHDESYLDYSHGIRGVAV